MLGFLKPKRPLSADEWEWHLACLKWLANEFEEIGGPSALQVKPSADYFILPSGEPCDVASSILAQTKSLTGLINWPTHLIVGEETRAPLIAGYSIEQFQSQAPGGTFQLMADENDNVIGQISFNPSNVHRHEKMAGTMAHELAHYLLDTAKHSPPGGEDCHELLTDMTAIWLGFGIFLANSSRSFEAYSSMESSGWQSEWSGYLSERAIITAFASIEMLAGREPEDAIPFLKSYLVSDLKMACKYLRSIDLSAAIESIDLEEYGVEAVSPAFEPYPFAEARPLPR